jgi:hypothetical protein
VRLAREVLNRAGYSPQRSTEVHRGPQRDETASFDLYSNVGEIWPDVLGNGALQSMTPPWSGLDYVGMSIWEYRAGAIRYLPTVSEQDAQYLSVYGEREALTRERYQRASGSKAQLGRRPPTKSVGGKVEAANRLGPTPPDWGSSPRQPKITALDLALVFRPQPVECLIECQSFSTPSRIAFRAFWISSISDNTVALLFSPRLPPAPTHISLATSSCFLASRNA